MGACLGMAALALVLVNCGGGGEDFSTTLSSGSSSTCGTYVDQISSSTRSSSQADPQCSSYVATADAMLQAARSACAQGNITAADANYANYAKLADYATSNVKLLCGGGGTSLPGGTSGGGNYNLFLCATGSGVVVSRSCTTSSKASSLVIGCNWYLAKTGLTSSQCQAEANKY